MGDGITNNSGVPTTDAAGYCNACNTHTSVWPDDDGGFLRLFVGRYYGGRVPANPGPGNSPPARGGVNQAPAPAPPQPR